MPTKVGLPKWVEQRNWQAVRRTVGYDRYSSQAALRALKHVYALLRLQLNYLRPVRKLVEKRRTGARITKVYDVPRTPYQRLLESGVLDEATRERLDKEFRASTRLTCSAASRPLSGACGIARKERSAVRLGNPIYEAAPSFR